MRKSTFCRKSIPHARLLAVNFTCRTEGKKEYKKHIGKRENANIIKKRILAEKTKKVSKIQTL